MCAASFTMLLQFSRSRRERTPRNNHQTKDDRCFRRTNCLLNDPDTAPQWPTRYAAKSLEYIPAIVVVLHEAQISTVLISGEEKKTAEYEKSIVVVFTVGKPRVAENTIPVSFDYAFDLLDDLIHGIHHAKIE